MIRKGIKEFNSYIFAEKENYTIEHRLFLSALVFGILISFLGSGVAIFISTSFIAVYITLGISGLLFVIYYFVRFKGIVQPFIVPIVIISFIGISTIWVFGGGINGSNIMLSFVVLILALIVVSGKLKKYIITLFLLLLVIVYFIQFYRPDVITKFPSENKRWMDSLITAIYSSLFIYFIIRFLLKSYTSERKKLEDSEAKYRIIVEKVGEGIGFVNSEEEFVVANLTAERIFGVGKGELLGRNLKEFLSYEQYKNIINQTNIRRKGEDSTYEFELTHPDGKKHDIIITAVPQFDDNNKFIGTHGIFRDITEAKQAELALKESGQRLLQLNADKDRFISILSHDLKNPFNNILGLSEVLTEDIRKLNIDEIEDAAISINKTARNTYNLLEDILLWARAQQGMIPFSPQNLVFTDICKNILETLNPIAKAKNIAVNYSSADYLNVFADSDMLKTVLRNLVSNAIKFTNNGGAININATQADSNVTISVSDNGIGIPPDSLAKLFNMSEVLKAKGTANETGTGLGLLLCKEFVKKHGGKIWVESEFEKGSDFKFILPISAGQANAI